MQPTKDEAPEWWNTLGLLGNNPTEPGITMNMILPEQTDLFQDTSRWPRRPYCTDDLESGWCIRSLKQALTKCYIQLILHTCGCGACTTSTGPVGG